MNLKWRLAALPFLIACGANKLDTAASLHRDSEALWRHGFTRKAIELADQGWRQWKNDRADQWHWKFCLLEAELLLNQGSSVRALALLEEGGNAGLASGIGHAEKIHGSADEGNADRNDGAIQAARTRGSISDSGDAGQAGRPREASAMRKMVPAREREH